MSYKGNGPNLIDTWANQRRKLVMRVTASDFFYRRAWIVSFKPRWIVSGQGCCFLHPYLLLQRELRLATPFALHNPTVNKCCASRGDSAYPGPASAASRVLRVTLRPAQDARRAGRGGCGPANVRGFARARRPLSRAWHAVSIRQPLTLPHCSPSPRRCAFLGDARTNVNAALRLMSTPHAFTHARARPNRLPTNISTDFVAHLAHKSSAQRRATLPQRSGPGPARLPGA